MKSNISPVLYFTNTKNNFQMAVSEHSLRKLNALRYNPPQLCIEL